LTLPVNPDKPQVKTMPDSQYYKFDYTGSNSRLGAPVKISDLQSQCRRHGAKARFLTPLKDAQDIYATLEVRF
jgi:hypothetical protein